MSVSTNHSWPPFYFQYDGALYQPNGLARSPWDRGAIAGGPIGGLLAHGSEDGELSADFEIARFSVDIFGKVPHEPLKVVVDCLRNGRQTKLHRTTLFAGERPVAQAHVLRVRKCETPTVPPPSDYAPPSQAEKLAGPHPASMAGGIEVRPIQGAPGVPGRGISWLNLKGQIVEGVTPSQFVKSSLFGDFGNGFGNALPAEDWSYANLDITLQFLRMPVGEWILIDAETHMAGNGHGTARNIFADETGVFARGAQTIFVAPGRGVKLRPISDVE